MKKNFLAYGLVPALALGTYGTVGAQPLAAANVMSEQGGTGQVAAAAEPVTQESLQTLHKELEQQLYQAQELQKRLNAQLGSLEKRMTKVEKKTNEPRVDIHGYGRFRWDKQHFTDFKGTNRKSVWLNLFVNHRINERWSFHSEHEFENSLSTNHGAYEPGGDFEAPGGKKYSRPVLQLYADGRVGDVNVKLGRYYLQSPYKFTFDEKIDGWQASYGIPTRWGRKANFTLNSGNTYSKVFYGDTENKLDIWAEGGSGNVRVLSLIGEIPVAKNTNISTHYGRITRRNDNLRRKTFSLGFDTKLNRDLKFWAALAKSDSNSLNKSHVLQLQYKEARADIPGSFDIYVKKYLQRGHTGMTNWFNDDIVDPTHGDYKEELRQQNPDDRDKPWQYRAGEFNGIRIGADFVPVRNTKLLVNYTFGKQGLFDAGQGKLTGKRNHYSFFRTQWEVYF